MKHYRIPLAIFFAITLLLNFLPLPSVQAEEAIAQDIRSNTTITGSGYDGFSFLFDNNSTSYKKSSGNTVITLKNAEGIGSIYLLLHKAYGSYTITDDTTGASITAGENSFLHEFVDLAQDFGYAPTSVTIDFANGAVQLSEIYVFSQGTPPEFVQIWEPALDGGADILLLATHGDDDQLFFAGLLPLYAGELDCRVQVVYLTDHRSGFVDNARMHEMLNGLWAVGVEAYPIWGDFADFRIDDLQDTYDCYKNSYGTTKDHLLSFVVEQIRRFRPQVIVGHDINGEYGHGMHMVYTDLLIQALDITADPTAYPASAETYGTWDVPKTYLHLYDENQIVLDYDQPLDHFGGLTAFQATQKLGYPCHKSQQYTWFTRWINGSSNEIAKATQINTYNPCYFGLYRSTVGEDVLKNDFLENITTYAQQEAQVQLDREAANSVSALIDTLGQISLSSGDAIAIARSAYESLTENQKALVTNLDKLTAAEKTHAQLMQEKAEKDAADLAAAQAVMAMIDGLGTTLDNPSPAQVRAAYDALSDDQKALVTNLDQLADAEARLQQILEEEEHNRLEQERAEQEELRQQQKELEILILILIALVVLLIIFLLILRHKRKAYQKR